MNPQLVEIQPRELKFTFEVKKQSSCTVHLANVTDQYIAFKVKTTSPKKYCVRPNVGIIKPKSTYDFTVTMQAQKSAFSDTQCKDKFLIQSTVVPFGTTEEEIKPGMFAKENLKYIEETKLRVALICAPDSPALADVALKQEESYETSKPKESQSPVLLPVNGFFKQEPSYETSMPKDNLQNGVENSPPPGALTKQVEAVQNVKIMEEPRSLKAMYGGKPAVAAVEEFYPERDDKSKQMKDLEDEKLKLTKDVEDLRLKISAMDSKLVEALNTIQKLKGENGSTIREKETLKQDLASRTTGGARKIQVGFPPLFVCMVALISLMIGSLFRA